MSHFLRNIITRHSVGKIRHESSHIVEPRLKSRFEADSSTGSSLAQHGSEIDPATASVVAASVGEELSRNQHVPPSLRRDSRQGNPASDRLDDELDDQIAALTEKSEQESMARKTPVDKTQQKRNHGIDVQTETAQITEPKSSQRLCVSDDLDQRIQIILHRLDSKQGQNTGHQLSVVAGKKLNPSNTVNSAKAALEEFPLVAEPALGFEHAGRRRPQSIENHPASTKTHQSGLLQTPEWVAEIKTDLKNRYRKINTQAGPEPVVNVTIGRVEVRAVQTVSVKQAKTRNKPSGIMSLDDYLKQRNRGRA